jgi:hypothetical protein
MSSLLKDTYGVVTSILYIGAIGDGCYVMGCNGYNYTHADNQDNGKSTGLTFTTGAEVTVEFDPIRRKVTYAVSNNGGEVKRYEQSVSAKEV